MVEPDRGKYLYCIIHRSEPREFTNRGMGDGGDLVYTVGAGDLAVVVSDSPEIEYERSRRNMLTHTLVLEEVVQEFTALPIRFGTVAPAHASIATELLDRRHDEFAGLLDEMEGRVELGLKAIWYEDTIFAEIVDENPPIRELRDSLKGKSTAETHFGRMRLGEMVQDAMFAKRDGDARAILARLEPLAVETRENPLFSDRMVLNAAFLVERENEPAFDRAVDELDAEMGRRLILKYVGPTPLYNFVSINVTWDQPGPTAVDPAHSRCESAVAENLREQR